MVQKISLPGCCWLLLLASSTLLTSAAAFRGNSGASLLQRRMSSVSASSRNKPLMVLGSAAGMSSADGEKKKVTERLEKTRVPSKKDYGELPSVNYDDGSGQGGSWKSLKEGLYSSIDEIGKLSSFFGSSDESDDYIVLGGYADVEKRITDEMESGSPGKRLMQEYKALSTSERRRIPSDSSDVEPNTGSGWDRLKEKVYGTVDAASSIVNSQEEESVTYQSPFQSDSEEKIDSIKPLVQSFGSSPEVKEIMKNVQSTDPIKRKLAEVKLQGIEAEERRRRRRIEREEAALKVKETAYKVGDAFVASVEVLASVPGKVASTAKENEAVVKGSVDLVSTIPQTVQSAAEGIKSSVDTGVEVSRKVIQDVKELPGNVERTIGETKETMKRKKEAFDESSTKVKVFLRLEKPKPKPPQLPPPKPPTTGEIGMQLAGNFAKGTVKVTADLAWWAVKGTSVAAWNGVTSAITSQVSDRAASPPVTASPKEEANSSVPAKPATTVEKESSDALSAEVEEALRQAQSALDFADQYDPLNLSAKSKKKEDEEQK